MNRYKRLEIRDGTDMNRILGSVPVQSWLRKGWSVKFPVPGGELRLLCEHLTVEIPAYDSGCANVEVLVFQGDTIQARALSQIQGYKPPNREPQPIPCTPQGEMIH